MPLEDGREGALRTLNVQNFPQSDALRVEMTCDKENKYVAFGHRNGQVSLLDLRQSHTCSNILQHLEDDSSHGGSATDLKFLSSCRQLLVKRSFGSCQLHDLRMTTTTTTKTKTRNSVIYNLTVPKDDIHPTLSANSNGFAVDPREQALLAPYINAQHEACLGMWSLGTGIMVGSKLLAPNPERNVIHTEVCQRTTPAFSRAGKMDKSSFGVWLKCGPFSESKINSKFGSLHHVTFPGSWKS
jgi:hypothetical protein